MILLKEVEQIPREIPEHTYLLLRCLELEYAQAFINRGSIRFANPSEWCKPDGTSRGDIFEGAYASQRGFNTELDRYLRALRGKPCTFKEKGYTFYKSGEMLSLRAHCLYGLNSNNMQLRPCRSQDHRYHLAGKVTKEYFGKLFPKVKKEVVETLPPKDRPAVLIIRPDLFVNYVKTRLIKKGVKEEEILIRPVSYFDYYYKPFIIGSALDELFSKHISYSEQSEIRIVVDTRRKEVAELFANNGVIELGKPDDGVATLSEFYFEDMIVEIRENINKIYYSLAKPKKYEEEEIDNYSIVGVFQQSLADELPDSPMSIEEIEKNMDCYFQFLKKRDPNVVYNKYTNVLSYLGKRCDLGVEAGAKMLEHYNIYINEGDYIAAGETVEKFKHFFPKYDMGNYFKAYYDWLKRNKEL